VSERAILTVAMTREVISQLFGHILGLFSRLRIWNGSGMAPDK
jgi:hypothetical protein